MLPNINISSYFQQNITNAQSSMYLNYPGIQKQTLIVEVTHAIYPGQTPASIQVLSLWSLLSSQCNGCFMKFRVKSTAHLSMEDEVEEKERPWCFTVISVIMFVVKIF